MKCYFFWSLTNNVQKRLVEMCLCKWYKDVKFIAGIPPEVNYDTVTEQSFGFARLVHKWEKTLTGEEGKKSLKESSREQSISSKFYPYTSSLPSNQGLGLFQSSSCVSEPFPKIMVYSHRTRTKKKSETYITRGISRSLAVIMLNFTLGKHQHSSSTLNISANTDCIE